MNFDANSAAQWQSSQLELSGRLTQAYYTIAKQWLATSPTEMPEDQVGLSEAFQALLMQSLYQPQVIANAQIDVAQQYAALCHYTMCKLWGLAADPVIEPQPTDYRFKNESWRNNLVFDVLKQSYLIAAASWQKAASEINIDDKHIQRKAEFMLKCALESMAPNNFPWSNPEVLSETQVQHGMNLLKGITNLAEDMANSNGMLRIKMTDKTAFKLGEDLAQTSGHVVFRNDMFELIHYNPQTEKQYAEALLFVPPWINKYYILDLRAKNSLVNWCLQNNHSVFMISWVNPDLQHADKNFENYLQEGLLTAMDEVLRATGQSQLNVVGYCLGGTLLSAALAWLEAKKDKRIRKASFMTSLIDFASTGDLEIFTDEKTVAKLSKKMAEKGYLDGAEMANSFNMLRANDLIWSFVIHNYLLGKDPVAFDLLFWNADSTRMPSAMHSYYLQKMYVENVLKEPGGLSLLGESIDVRSITVPSCFISAEEDHIAPWTATYNGARLFGGKVKFILAGSGHIAGMINHPDSNKYGHKVLAKEGALPESSDDFYAKLKSVSGSWWPTWQEWLTRESKPASMVDAYEPTKCSEALCAAPGEYVLKR